MNKNDLKTYAIVIDNEVAGRIMVVVAGSEDATRMAAALSSNPTIIETTEINPEIDFGWSYDGTDFIPPAL